MGATDNRTWHRLRWAYRRYLAAKEKRRTKIEGHAVTITFIEAIARKEGWLVATSRCRRNNNPGNLNFKRWQVSYGATLETGSKPRFAQFPSPSQGFAAMSHLLTEVYQGVTVRNAITHWAPPTENDTEKYIVDVCEFTGLTPDTVLTEVILAPPNSTT